MLLLLLWLLLAFSVCIAVLTCRLLCVADSCRRPAQPVPLKQFYLVAFVCWFFSFHFLLNVAIAPFSFFHFCYFPANIRSIFNYWCCVSITYWHLFSISLKSFSFLFFFFSLLLTFRFTKVMAKTLSMYREVLICLVLVYVATTYLLLCSHTHN